MAISPPNAPPPIARRLAQAFWPEVLFDSDGRPVPGSRTRGFRGNPAEGFRVTRAAAIPTLPSVEVWYGMLLRCIDCGAAFAAVAIHGADTVSVISPSDLELLLPWIPGVAAHPDSTTIRTATLELLNATCILNCPAREIHSKDDLDEMTRIMARSAGPDTAWQVPRATLGENGSFMEYQLAIYAGGDVHQLSVGWTYDGDFLVSSAPVAYHGFP